MTHHHDTQGHDQGHAETIVLEEGGGAPAITPMSPAQVLNSPFRLGAIIFGSATAAGIIAGAISGGTTEALKMGYILGDMGLVFTAGYFKGNILGTALDFTARATGYAVGTATTTLAKIVPINALSTRLSHLGEALKPKSFRAFLIPMSVGMVMAVNDGYQAYNHAQARIQTATEFALNAKAFAGKISQQSHDWAASAEEATRKALQDVLGHVYWDKRAANDGHAQRAAIELPLDIQGRRVIATFHNTCA